MGFAVVADEVRNLAQRSAQAAKDTAVLIEESLTHSSQGAAKLHDVSSAIQLITESAVGVKELVGAVNVGTGEQLNSLEQIGKAVLQMGQVTQRAAANAEESASSSEELSAMAEFMKESAQRLRSLVGNV